MIFNVPARPPIYNAAKKKAAYLEELAFFAARISETFSEWRPCDGADVVVEVSTRRRTGSPPKLVSLCTSVVRALEEIGIDVAKFNSLKYALDSSRRDFTRITFK